MKAANKREERDAEPSARDRRKAAQRARRVLANNADAMPVVESSGPRRERVVDAPLVHPDPRGGITEVLRERYLLRLIVGRELASMYAASLLGLMWSYVQPALRFSVYYLVMGFILKLHDGVPYFAIHLFCGMVMVHYFGETWSGGTRSIWQNRALVLKMRMPREIFPVASMVVAAYHTLPQMLVLVLACLVSGWAIDPVGIAAGVLGLLLLTTFSMTMALTFSALNVFFRDFQNIVGTIMQFMHFMVPMMYPFARVYAEAADHPILYNLYVSNPVAQAVMLMQRFFWWPLVSDSERAELGVAFPPDLFPRALITLAVCLGLLFLAQKFFSRVEGKFPERL